MMPSCIKHLVKQLLKELIQLRIFAYKYLFAWCRVQKDKIVFVCDCYNCNPKSISEEILRRSKSFNLIWLSDYDLQGLPSAIRFCRKSSFWGAYHLSSAKIIVINSKGEPIRFAKKKGQFYIQTCHGSLPLKYIEAECEEKLPSFYVRNSKKDSVMTDLMLSDGKWTTNLCRNALWYQGEILECGYPRNDIYFKASENEKTRIKRELGVREKKRIVTYAPTFRDNGDMSCYSLDTALLLETLQQKTGDEWVLLIRSHPDLHFTALNFDYSDTVRDVTRYPDAQELFLVTDLLVTDYSSIMIDFMLMHKPVLILAIDEQQYVNLRGIRPEFYQLPFPHCNDNEALIGQLKLLDLNHPYSNDFLKSYGSVDNGNASKQVVDRIIHETQLN